MPQITLVKGDLPIKDLTDNYVIVTDINNKEQFLTKNFDGVYPHKIVEASLSRIPIDTLRWIAAKSIYPVIMFFVDGKIPEGLNKTGMAKSGFKSYTNEFVTVSGTVTAKETLFDVLEEIMNNNNRVEVYNLLEKNVSLHYVIMLYLISNVSMFEQNRDAIGYMDILALFRNSQRVSELIAFCFKPINRKVFLKYNFPKKEKE